MTSGGTVDVQCPRCGEWLVVDTVLERLPVAPAGSVRFALRPVLPEHDCGGPPDEGERSAA